MGVCGLEGLARTYTKDTIVFPGKDEYLFMDLHTNFICGGGDAGDLGGSLIRKTAGKSRGERVHGAIVRHLGSLLRSSMGLP